MGADVIVIGAGVSGLSLALEAARAGRSVLVLERDERVGGCLATHRTASGYWVELGAHTCYNSYVGLADALERCGLRGEVVARAPTKLRFLDGDRLLPGANLWALLRLLAWGEALRSLPRALGKRKEGETVYSYYSRMVGRRNYGNVLGPMLSAVPSQSADAFPAHMLFKSRRARRKDLPRSFTLRSGLLSLAEAMARQPGMAVALGRPATRIGRTAAGFAVETRDGERHEASAVALATAPSAAAALLRGAFPELASQVARVREVEVESLGFAVRASKVALPVSMFLVPRDDVFHSVVTRDPVPDPEWRGFAFHFRPGVNREAKIRRATALLGLRPGDLEDVAERRTALPSPILGHEEVVREIDRLTAGLPLCVTGNWFGGLALEDCVERSRSEWARLKSL
jgi:oxygen-dependent protoporphyrinogen oxidase